MKNFIELNNEELMDVNGGAASYVNYNSATNTVRIWKANNSAPNSFLEQGGRMLNSKTIQQGGQNMTMNVYRRADGTKLITYNPVSNSRYFF